MKRVLQLLSIRAPTVIGTVLGVPRKVVFGGLDGVPLFMEIMTFSVHNDIATVI